MVGVRNWQQLNRLAAKAIDGGGSEESSSPPPAQDTEALVSDGDIDEGVLLALAGFLETVGESMVSQ